MNPILAETSVQVLGNEVTDPVLQVISFLTFIPIFVGIFALAMTARMVDEGRIRAEPSISKLFGRGLPPHRVLTDVGRKVRVAAFITLGVGGTMMLYLIVKTR